MNDEAKLQRRVASWLALLSFAGLLLGYSMVAICLFHALNDGRLADLWAPPSGGNHGPWRHYSPARQFLDPSILVVMPAGLLAAMSFALHARRLPGLVMLGCFNYFLIYVVFFAAALD